MKPAGARFGGSSRGEEASSENRRALDGLENLEERDLVGRTGEGITANRPTVRSDEIVPPELLKCAGEKVSGDVGGAGNVPEKHDAALGLSGEDQQAFQRVVAFACQHDSMNQLSLLTRA